MVAYASGIFPMPVRPRRLGWWSPERRGVLPLDGLVSSRSLRRSLRRYTVTIDECFDRVVEECRTLPRPHGWITREITDAYVRLHHLGLAHSVECWSSTGDLAGGLYGVSIGGLFAGESMFHREVDASKVALAHLVDLLGRRPGGLLDVQWQTPHLERLGVVEMPRTDYIRAVGVAIDAPNAFT